MERIETNSYKNTLISGYSCESTSCNYEVSHYGVIYGKDKKIIENKTAGFLIRAKPSMSNEGGVMDGTGAITSWMIEDVRE